MEKPHKVRGKSIPRRKKKKNQQGQMPGDGGLMDTKVSVTEAQRMKTD